MKRDSADWAKVPSKFLYHLQDSRVEERTGLPLLSVSIHRGVVPRSDMTDRLSRAEDLSDYKMCAPGDIIINRMRVFQGAVGISLLVGVVSPEYLVLRPVSGNEPRFLCYLIKSAWFVSEMSARLRGIGSVEQGNVRTPRINPSDLGSIKVALPSSSTQRAIAGYLDSETARIDDLIEKKRRMVEVLGERTEALIEWQVADPPRSVNAGLSKFLVERITDGPHETPEFVEDGVPFMSIEGVVHSRLNFEGCRMISAEQHREYSRKCLAKRGDVLLAKTGATIGKVAIVDTDREFSIWSPLALLRPNADVLDPRYLWFYLRSPDMQRRIRLYATQSTQPNIAMPDIAQLRISVPTIEYQRSALHRLVLMEEKIEQTQSVLRRQLVLLTERRQALITAAVTGELDIAGIAA